MQAIARVNRVFRDKPGGLVVDYLGLADELRKALADVHRERRHRARTAIDQARGGRADAREVRGLLRPVPRLRPLALGDRGRRGAGLAAPGARRSTSSRRRTARPRLLQAVTELSAAFALAVPADEALAIRDDVGFFQAVRAVLAKSVAGERRTDEELDHAIRQIVSRAIVSDEVIDIFAAAGLQEARHLDPVRRVPRRGPRPAAAQRRGRAAAQAAGGRDQVARPAERRPGALVRRPPRAGAPPLPEPGDRDGPGDRGADRARQGDPRRRPPAARSSASPTTSSPSTTPSRPTTARSRCSASPSSSPSPAS